MQGGSSSASSQPTTLSLSQIAAPDSFAPGNFGTGPNSQYLQPVYDSLLRNDENGEPTQNVATDWSYDATQTTLSMTLRDGITFTDGTKLDAAAVKTGLEAAKKGTGEAGGQLRDLKSVDVVDPTHVKLVLTAPDPSLLPNLGRNAGMLASPAAVGKESLKTEPVGSGPYVLDKAQTQAGNKYVYTRNTSYWGDRSRTLTTPSTSQSSMTTTLWRMLCGRGRSIFCCRSIQGCCKPQVRWTQCCLPPGLHDFRFVPFRS